MQSFQEIMFVYACGNAIHLRKSFAVRTNVSGLCGFKFNSMAHPVFMLCQDGDRLYIVHCCGLAMTQVITENDIESMNSENNLHHIYLSE
jgi:Fe-S oxidoreductase